MKQTTSLKFLILIAICAVFLMSFVPVLIRWTSANEVTIGIVRLIIASLGIAALSRAVTQLRQIKYRDWIWLAVLGCIFGLHWYAYFRSIKLADASLAAIGVATFGIHLLILNRLFTREAFHLSDWFAVILSFVGMIIASPRLSLQSDAAYGFLLSILSGFLYACLPIVNRRLLHLETQVRALGQFSFALLVFLAMLPKARFDLPAQDWVSLVTLGVICTLLAHTLWIKASSELPAKFTAVIYYAYVPLAMFLSYWILDEKIDGRRILGAVLIIGSNLLVVLIHKRQQSSRKANLL